ASMRSATPTSLPALDVLVLLECPGRDLDAGSQSTALYGDEPERGRLRRGLTLTELSAKCLGNDGAQRFALRSCPPFEVGEEAVVQGDRRPHASHHTIGASLMQKTASSSKFQLGVVTNMRWEARSSASWRIANPALPSSHRQSSAVYLLW